jgi:hypothetical protein
LEVEYVTQLIKYTHDRGNSFRNLYWLEWFVVKALSNGLSQFEMLDDLQVHILDMDGWFAKRRCLKYSLLITESQEFFY